MRLMSVQEMVVVESYWFWRGHGRQELTTPDKKQDRMCLLWVSIGHDLHFSFWLTCIVEAVGDDPSLLWFHSNFSRFFFFRHRVDTSMVRRATEAGSEMISQSLPWDQHSWHMTSWMWCWIWLDCGLLRSLLCVFTKDVGMSFPCLVFGFCIRVMLVL